MISAKHFTLLLKRQWLENRKAWLIGALALAGILAFLFLLTWRWRTSFNGDTTKGIFLLMLFTGGILFMSTILKDLGNKQKGIWLLILPASALVKLVVALFYGVIAYLVVYFGIFYLVRELMLLAFGAEATLWASLDLMKNSFYQFVFVYIIFQSIVLLGSVYFNKSQFLKTILITMILFFAAFNGNGLLLKLITGEMNINANVPLDSFQFAYGGDNIYVRSTALMTYISCTLLWFIVPVTLWVITWFRIKEKEL
jgi:hypothetical protein